MADPVDGEVGREHERGESRLERLLDDLVADLAIAEDVDLEPARRAGRRRGDLGGVAVATVERHMSVPAAAAPRAIATSPSSCAICWNAIGATSTGIDTGRAEHGRLGRHRRDVDEHARPEPKRENASRFQRSVRSSPAPPDDVAPRLGRDGLLGQALGVVDGEKLLHGRGA